MSESYNAIYDAVRSRISRFDGQSLIDRIAYQFDFSHQIQRIQEEFISVAHDMQQPAVLFRPKLSIDGNMWCALYGDNLQDGVAGFGESPSKAMEDFDKNWNEKL